MANEMSWKECVDERIITRAVPDEERANMKDFDFEIQKIDELRRVRNDINYRYVHSIFKIPDVFSERAAFP